MMKGITYLIIGLTMIILLFACNKDKGPFFIEEADISEIDTVSYSTHIQPIFDMNCVACHNASHAKLDLLTSVSYNELLTTGFSAPYVNTTNPEQSNLYLHLTGALSIMPPAGSLSLNDQELVLLWITQGALNN